MSEKDSSPEILIHVPRAWLFDCDGPLTDPVQKRITTDGLVETIAASIIDNGELAAINTGRSNSWLLKNGVLPSIEQAVSQKDLLKDFIAVGEKGATWSVYEDNLWVTYVDDEIKVPHELQKTIHDLVEREFSDCMFFDSSKHSMISIEMQDGYSLELFAKRQELLLDQLQGIVNHQTFPQLEIDPTTIATDIQNKQVGKHLGAQRIVSWMKEKGIVADHFITVGDSTSDKEMADELSSSGHSVEFVFVNDESKLSDKNASYPITYTKEKFGKGTVEFISSVHSRSQK